MRRVTVEDSYRIHIWQVARELGNDKLKKSLKVEFDFHGTKQVIKLTITKPHYGGERLWFLCPDCGRRVGTLYCPPHQPYFACRCCHDIRYEVQTKHRDKFYENVERPIKRIESEKKLVPSNVPYATRHS